MPVLREGGYDRRNISTWIHPGGGDSGGSGETQDQAPEDPEETEKIEQQKKEIGKPGWPEEKKK